MENDNFYKSLKRRLAQISVGSSAIRNQGESGLIKELREYFEVNIEIDEFVESLSDEEKYKKFLDTHTLNILSKFPLKAKECWGAARKGLNLFLREVAYNKFYSDLYNFPKDLKEYNDLIQFMEVPLDADVATGLIEHSGNTLPKWKSIKNLSHEDSKSYQDFALKYAGTLSTARVNLDLIYWRRKAEGTEPAFMPEKSAEESAAFIKGERYFNADKNFKL